MFALRLVALLLTLGAKPFAALPGRLVRFGGNGRLRSRCGLLLGWGCLFSLALLRLLLPLLLAFRAQTFAALTWRFARLGRGGRLGCRCGLLLGLRLRLFLALRPLAQTALAWRLGGFCLLLGLGFRRGRLLLRLGLLLSPLALSALARGLGGLRLLLWLSLGRRLLLLLLLSALLAAVAAVLAAAFLAAPGFRRGAAILAFRAIRLGQNDQPGLARGNLDRESGESGGKRQDDARQQCRT